MSNFRIFGRIILMTFLVVVSSCSDDPCDDVICNNGGDCIEGNCDCPTGYEGTTCDVESRTKYLGGWNTVDWDCGFGIDDFTFVFEPGSGILEMSFFDPTEPDAKIACHIEGNMIVVDSQVVVVDGELFTLEGTGSLENETLSLILQVKVQSELFTCSGTFTM